MTIREYLKTLLQGVKTYVDEKIVKSDWNVNDENSTSYIKNRTHYDARVETTKIITFDGNFEDKEVLKPTDYQWFVRLSDDYVSAEKLIGKNIEYYNGNNGSTTTIQVTNDLIAQGGSYQSIQGLLILCEGDVGVGPINLTKGIWTICEMDGETPLTYVSSLEVPVTEGEIKTLDEMYLPETTKYQSDWNVNDETSTSYIKNRTHYDARVETVKTITFDGTFEGKEVVKDTFDTDKWFTKVSDEYFPSDKMIGKNISMCADGESMSFPIASNGFYKHDGYYNLYGYIIVCEKEVKIILREQIGTYVILSKGVWFMSDVDEQTSIPKMYISSLEVPALEGEVKTLDEMYLPETTKYQSDWNVNDETNPAFVKNRPFYTTDPVETTIVEQTTFELQDGMGFLTSTKPLEVGQEYAITLDGATYNCVAKMNDGFGMVYIGNAGLMGAGEDTGELFFIAPLGSEIELGIMINSDVLEHAVSIAGMISEVYKIDEKYLPDSLFEEKVGLSTTGTVYTIDGEEVIACDGAEIFNCYVDNESNEAYANIAIGYYSHAEGGKTQAYGEFSHAEGCRTIAGDYSHAEGKSTVASGHASHAEGYDSESRGKYSHAEGNESIASGNSSHVEGCHTAASKNSTHAEGFWTVASSNYQHVQGKFNIEDTANKYAHIVGNGTSKDAKSNAHTVDWSGNAWFAGDVLVGGASQDDASTLATETYADNAANTVKNDLLNGVINEMNTTIGDIETALDTILGV